VNNYISQRPRLAAMTSAVGTSNGPRESWLTEGLGWQPLLGRLFPLGWLYEFDKV